MQNPTGTVIRDVPPPPCRPGTVLVRNEFSVISSGTERSWVQAARRSAVSRVLDQPQLVLKLVERLRRDGIGKTRALVRETMSEEIGTGYSSAGRVIEVGAAVRGLSVGDRVACAGHGYASHAELVAVPRNLCAAVPAEVPMPAAALTTLGSIALHGIRLADVRLGDRVAVIGCGLVGQIACRLLTTAGADVFALDLDSDRVAQSTAAGAHRGFVVDDHVAAKVRKAAGGAGVDQVIVCAATTSPEPLLLAADLARDRATVILVGDVPVELPRSVLYAKELSFRVSRSYGPGRDDANYEERGLDYPIGYVRWTEQRNMECVLELQARGALVLSDLVDDIIPVTQAEEAYARLAGPPEHRPRGALALAYPPVDGADPDAPSPLPSISLVPVASQVQGAVKVGLVGPGNFARAVLIPALLSANATLAVVAGGSGPSAEALARTAGFPRVAASEADLIADQGVDAIVIATRHGAHARLAQMGLEGGKHVFCEKPLALNAAQLHGVLETARASGRVLTVGFNRRFAAQAVEMREFLSGSRGPMTLVYRVSAGRVPVSSWLNDLDEGGGRLLGECCHFIDLAAFLTGSQITQVHASGFGRPDQPLQTVDNVVVTLSFGDGSVCTLAYVAEGATAVPKERLEAFAGDRTAILDDYQTLELFDGEHRKTDRLRSQDKGHREEMKHFISGVRSGQYPIALDVIENVHLACFAAVESLRTGHTVALPHLEARAPASAN